MKKAIFILFTAILILSISSFIFSNKNNQVCIEKIQYSNSKRYRRKKRYRKIPRKNNRYLREKNKNELSPEAKQGLKAKRLNDCINQCRNTYQNCKSNAISQHERAQCKQAFSECTSGCRDKYN